MSPSTSVRLFVAFLVARGAFGLSYLAGSVRRSPIPWYYPLERRFAFESVPTGLAMEWYGRTAAALLCAVAAFALAWALSARAPFARSLSRPAVVLSIARAGGLILLIDFVYFGWVFMHSTRTPLPEPSSRRSPTELRAS